ncbi:caspase family protein [Cellulophaga sp. BC115SP]|uniref:caspase family protein n=1 Tax=Cellulophaga sp. BC115SP TaxID=2683263 RepID=UPI0014132CA0|nr:caspase family protein [Cellulophaga sp. BC115SP]NBB31528.1 hypothetical protein [Cellulophaga sp. BC115SP]
MKQIYAFLWLLLICQQLIAQKKGMVPVGNQLPIGTERRLALIVGNKDYQNPDAVLKNPINDAIAMRNALQKLGFDVLYYNNLDRVAFEKAIDDFGVKLNNYNVGLFYYSGHGIQAQGENYLVPIDANIIGTEAVVNYTCVNMGRVLGLMEGSKAETNLVFLDACRNNPFKKSWGNKGEIQRGFAIPRNPPGTCVVYATSAGATADDNVASTNGLFTENLLQYLSIPNMSLSSILNGTRKEVYKKSNKTQLPEDHVKLLGDFYFLVSRDAPKPVPVHSEINSYKKIALVIGNANYTSGPLLINATNDADSMEVVLKKSGYEVIKMKNLSKIELRKAIVSFNDKLSSYSEALVYYSGFGLVYDGQATIISTDFKNEAFDTEVTLKEVFAESNANRRDLTKIIIWDSCLGTQSKVETAPDFNIPQIKNSIYLFATAVGGVAMDGYNSGRNGLFTSVLLQQLAIPNQRIQQIAINTRNKVRELSDNKQVPFSWENLYNEVVFLKRTDR